MRGEYRAARNDEIVRLRLRGETLRAIGIRYRISANHVMRICRWWEGEKRRRAGGGV